jgi:hypothetical protein
MARNMHTASIASFVSGTATTKTWNKSIIESINESMNQWINESMNQWMNQWINESIDR